MKSLRKYLNKASSFSKSAVSCTSLHEHTEVNLIKDSQEEYKSKLISYFESLLNILNGQIKHFDESQLISSKPLSEHSIISE
jgi:hypothetical protein